MTPDRYVPQPRAGWIPPMFVVVDRVQGLTVSRCASEAQAREIARGLNTKPKVTP